MAKRLVYPHIDISRIKNPNRFYAFPLLGGVVKFIILIPVFFWMFLLGIAFVVMSLINAFVVLFTGNYWKSFYEINVLLISLSAKVSYFFPGLTNTYPGFDAKTPGFSLDIPYPKNPSRFFAIPILGAVARIVLMIPFFIYVSIIQNAGRISAVVASFPVLFMGTYPDALYELPRDSVRLNLASMMYLSGLEDTYPSFWISMKHKGIKILFIVLGILIFLSRFFGNHQTRQQYRYQYNGQQPTTNSTY